MGGMTFATNNNIAIALTNIDFDKNKEENIEKPKPTKINGSKINNDKSKK